MMRPRQEKPTATRLLHGKFGAGLFKAHVEQDLEIGLTHVGWMGIGWVGTQDLSLWLSLFGVLGRSKSNKYVFKENKLSRFACQGQQRGRF